MDMSFVDELKWKKPVVYIRGPRQSGVTHEVIEAALSICIRFKIKTIWFGEDWWKILDENLKKNLGLLTSTKFVDLRFFTPNLPLEGAIGPDDLVLLDSSPRFKENFNYLQKMKNLKARVIIGNSKDPDLIIP